MSQNRDAQIGAPETPPARRFVPFAAGAAFFALMAALYLGDARPAYFNIIRLWGIDPWPTPFLDTDTVMSALRCLRGGVDVYVANPCDPLTRVYDYSPLWLVLAHLPVTQAWLVPAGLAVDVAFLLSLLLLPAGRSRAATAGIVLGVLSSPVLFAVERGNNDLVLFALAAVAAALACRSPALRVVGYGAALLAGLLKYYPMTLLLLATRERPLRFVAVAVAAMLLAGLFVVMMGHDLARALHLIPTGTWFGTMFGSTTLPGGLATQWKLPPSTAGLLYALLVAGALGAAARLAMRRWFVRDIARLTPLEGATLFAGALLILSCFFAAQNIAYRATHLLLVLPALTALHHSGQARRLYGAAVLGVLALMWSDAWRGGPDQMNGHGPHLLGVFWPWLLREAIWWAVVPILIAGVVVLLGQSEIGRRLLPGRFAAIEGPTE